MAEEGEIAMTWASRVVLMLSNRLSSVTLGTVAQGTVLASVMFL